MSRFDSTINVILENIIFEETDDVKTADNIVKRTIQEIQNRLKTDPDAFRAESEAKYNSGQEIENAFVKEFSQIQNSVNESAEDLKNDLSNAWNLFKDKGKELWSTVAPAVQNTQDFLADLAVENMGPIVRKVLGDEYVDDIKNNLSENMVYKIIAVLEPTGVMSWPYLAKAREAYEANIGTENEDIYQLNLLAAQISVIPGVRVPFRILTLPFRLVTGSLTAIVRVFGLKGSQKMGRGLGGFFKYILGSGPKVEKGVETVVKAPVKTTAVGKIAQKPAAKAIKTLPQKTAKAATTATKTASNKVLDASKKVAKGTASVAKIGAKIGATGAKVGTVVASGNIPDTINKWKNDGGSLLDKIGNRSTGTLGSFPSFREISTQRF